VNDEGAWPRRLAPRESVEVFLDDCQMHWPIGTMTHVYARTECRAIVFARNNDVREYCGREGVHELDMA
jgi:hypothetical protein